MNATAEKGELQILDHTGHSKTIWDPDVPAEVEAAKTQFNALKAKGYIAYRVDKGGEKGEVMGEFDRSAGKVILSPPLAGG